ncbi:hypothetical protein [Methylobacterium indicum]|uniref:hypothetical protein n=1 Tax=Methylobacterium indicum TaxID=1775910 RepID=UPI000A93D35B|nr:hypothetical protein [Methylobacterium indicum]
MSETEESGDEKAIERLVAAVMKVERKYAHALRGVVSDRREDIHEAIEAIAKESE